MSPETDGFAPIPFFHSDTTSNLTFDFNFPQENSSCELRITLFFGLSAFILKGEIWVNCVLREQSCSDASLIKPPLVTLRSPTRASWLLWININEGKCDQSGDGCTSFSIAFAPSPRGFQTSRHVYPRSLVDIQSDRGYVSCLKPV